MYEMILLGVGATLTMDLWAIVHRKLWGTPSLNFALVGRWIGYMPQGIFIHHSIAEAPRIRGERIIGWSAHYLIGIIFAGLFLHWNRADWLRAPDIVTPLLFGVLTVVMPFLIMQPGFGLGIAANRTPNPTSARLRSVMAHLIFGSGLYVTARLLLIMSA